MTTGAVAEELALRYGMNPHQKPARAFVESGPLPLQVLQGAPGYINLLDALIGWQLVRELSHATGLPAAASMKHTAPAGAALGLPLNPALASSWRVAADTLSPLAEAYARARGSDRQASFGDLAVLSNVVDESTASLLAREVSDGVMAPDYTPEALAVLRQKRHGQYLVLSIDEAWEPAPLERRHVFGITLEQPRNDVEVTVGEIVTRNTDLSAEARRDLLIAAITLKYTPSNSITLASGGSVIGVGAGQQSRIACTRLACGKAETWWLRQHPRALSLRFRKGILRPDADNAIDDWLRGTPSDDLVDASAYLSTEERSDWLSRLSYIDLLRDVGVLALASDGLIPFRDNVDFAARHGVAYIWQPGGSARDEDVIRAADEHTMVMCFSGQRLFHH